MTTLTLAVDEQTLEQAQMRALGQGTSVDAVLREFLEAYAGVHRERDEVVRELLRLSKEGGARRGRRSWTRDELHERP